MLHIPTLWYFDISEIYPHGFRRVKFVIIPPCFGQQHYLWNITLQPEVGFYNMWANICCSGYSLLEEKNHCSTIRCIPFLGANYAVLLIGTNHYGDVIMGAMASQITSLPIVYLTVHSGTDQRKHQSSTSLAFVWGIHRWPVNSPHKWPVMQKMFPFDDVIMILSISTVL